MGRCQCRAAEREIQQKVQPCGHYQAILQYRNTNFTQMTLCADHSVAVVSVDGPVAVCAISLSATPAVVSKRTR